jgi:Zn-dependent protease with chaperone function
LVNSIFSLIAGLLVVNLFLWFFRVETGPWKLFLLSLPFAKIAYDCARGLPKDSILFTTVDTFSMPPRSHYLKAGAGFSEWGPTFSLQFSVKDLDGKEYAESVGDYLVLWLNKTFGHEIPLVILSMVLTVSATLLTIRFIQALRFERERRLDRAHSKSLREIKLWRRTVDVYLSNYFSGTPFTGGIFKPYICIPVDAQQKLNPEELEAVIAHELGHVRQFDLAVTIAVQILGDFFWFIPGYRWLSRKIDRLREIVADQWAVYSGIEPPLLASALVKLKEIPAPDRFVLYSAFFREKSLLKLRVAHLLEGPNERKPRFGWQNKWLRRAVCFWIFTAVMTATFGGNHRTDKIKNPEWVDQLLQKWGLAVT